MDRMSALKDKLKADLTASMKSRDEIRTRTIRMALAAVEVEEVSGKTARELSDDEVVKVLAKEAKKRREAAEAFSGAGRTEQAQAELDEQAVLEEYLPAQLSDEELGRLVDEAVAESGAAGPQAMGQVMKVAQPEGRRTRRGWPGGAGRTGPPGSLTTLPGTSVTASGREASRVRTARRRTAPEGHRSVRQAARCGRSLADDARSGVVGRAPVSLRDDDGGAAVGRPGVEGGPSPPSSPP